MSSVSWSTPRLHKCTDFGSLLTPLGEHRKAHIQPSKGKKRKRDMQSTSNGVSVPLPPAIGSHVLVGLNSITRYLEALAAGTVPPAASLDKPTASEHEQTVPGNDIGQQTETFLRPLGLVILTHPQPSLSPSHAHVPELLHLATVHPQSRNKSLESTRLVTLPTSNDARLASALHIPRVGAVGIFEGAPGAKALEDYARKHVGLTECPWIEQATKPEWRGLNVQKA